MKKLTVFYKFFVCIFSLYLIAVIMDAYLSAPQKRGETSSKTIQFNQQFLHPYYFFSFPTRPDLLEKLNDKNSWVDARGFRGPGPEKRGKRKLAFLLGGSTAFGHGTDANETTITGVLNRIQGEYFFVNTGVPSWNSFQELLRYLKQVQNENPALVISLSGFNDIITAFDRKDSSIPPDAPESFEDLSAWVEDIRSTEFRDNAVKEYLQKTSILRHFRLRQVFTFFGIQFEEQQYRKKHLAQPNVSLPRDAWVHQTIDRYLENMTLINNYCALKKTKFMVFFQPYLYASATDVPSGINPASLNKDFREFFVVARSELNKREIDFVIDISDPFYNSNLRPADFYSDEVHFNDAGYEHIARLIWSKVKARDNAAIQ